MLRRAFAIAITATVVATAPVAAQYDIPLGKSAPGSDPRLPADPKPVFKYELKPEHGAFLVCVKTFRGTDVGDKNVKELAEGLAEYIRSECRLNAYVYERGWQQRQKQREELVKVLADKKKWYEKEGITPTPELLRRDLKLPRIPDEYAVLIAPGKGQLKSLEEAVEFAHYVRKLKAPPAEYCDALVVAPEKGFSKNQGDAVNPFMSAFPGPNPTIAKETAQGIQRPKADAFLMKLNADEPLSLLHKTKNQYTLIVKTFGGEPQVLRSGQPSDGAATGTGDRLERAALQAQQLAKLLRDMKPGFDAYVLHTPYNSIVCVGDFDRLDHPEVEAKKKALSGMSLTDKKTGQSVDSLMEKPAPVMIPRP